jgi:HK97 family phage major capsid protein
MGGVTFEWVAEGGAKPETDYDLEGVKTEPQEYAAHVVVTDKLLRNSQAAAVFMRRILSMGIGQSVDATLIKGNGVGKPSGVWNSAAAIEVARAGAGAWAFTDVVNMLAALLPESWGRARWALHQTLLPSTVNLADAAGNSIFIAGDARRGISPSLLGLPIRWTGKTYALGTRGDAALMDFSYYLVRNGAGPFIAASEHVYFLNNKTVVKAFGSIDGQPWLKEPLTMDDGATQVSPFVILKA